MTNLLRKIHWSTVANNVVVALIVAAVLALSAVIDKLSVGQVLAYVVLPGLAIALGARGVLALRCARKTRRLTARWQEGVVDALSQQTQAQQHVAQILRQQAEAIADLQAAIGGDMGGTGR